MIDRKDRRTTNGQLNLTPNELQRLLEETYNRESGKNLFPTASEKEQLHNLENKTYITSKGECSTPTKCQITIYLNHINETLGKPPKPIKPRKHKHHR